MKKILLIPTFLFLFSVVAFSQTVYINQSGTTYHTKACKLYTKNFEAVQLWQAKDVHRKKPCTKCNPPTKEVKGGAKKKPAAKPKPAAAKPVKKK